MYERILKRMRDKVRTRQYIMTLHAVEEMDDDGLSVFDVEHIVLTGEIVERQNDDKTYDDKYLVAGYTLSGERAFVVSKISPTGNSSSLLCFRNDSSRQRP